MNKQILRVTFHHAVYFSVLVGEGWGRRFPLRLGSLTNAIRVASEPEFGMLTLKILEVW